MKRALALLAALAIGCKRPPTPAAPAAGSLLGGERGLDHVGIAVRDLAAARATFHDALGFGAAEAGRLPNGIANINYYFEDSTYLETLTAADPQKARWIAQLTARGETTAFAALAVASAEETAAFLAAHGLKTQPPIPGTLQTARDDAGAERWRTLFFDGTPLPGNPIFFIAYAQPARAAHLRALDEAVRSARVYRHPNGALGVKAAWLAVPALAPAVQAFAAAGLPALDAFVEPRLGARGRALDAGSGKLLLVEPDPAIPNGAVAAFLRARGDAGLLGLSIEVARLGTAQLFVARATGKPAPPARGALGASIFVGPETAHGAWLELFER